MTGRDILLKKPSSYAFAAHELKLFLDTHPKDKETLKKLSEKGFAQNVDTIVTSLVPQEDVQAYASEHFVEHTFEGSLPKFLVAFLGDKKISEEEAAELKQLIDQYKEG